MNMTPVIGSTIMISKPHFLDADVSAYENILGMAPNRELHDTVIDVEPFTGSVFRGNKRLQVSLSLPDWWSLCLPSHSQAPRVLYPLLWFDLEGSATDDQASKMRDQIYGSLKLMKITLISGITLSLIATTVFALTLFIHRRRNANRGGSTYTEVA
jgi:lysosome membrane protein 2